MKDDHSDSSEHAWWYPEESDEPYPENLPERQFERSGDILEFQRDEEDDARRLISKYEDAEVTEIVATPEHGVADWQATFADGHVVLFWIDETCVSIIGRVHIVERK